MWLAPSRGRPHLAQRLFDSGIRERGVLILDDDEADTYGDVRLPFGWQRLILPRQYLGPKLNAAYAALPHEPWYGILNDDHLPVTPEWESAIIAAAGHSGMAWPDDNYGKRISAHVKGGYLCRLLGWFVCPAMQHYFLDDADELVAGAVGGAYLSSVMVSHEHCNAGRAPVDKTYRERPNWAADKAAFETWREREWPALEDRLKEWRICGIETPDKPTAKPAMGTGATA